MDQGSSLTPGPNRYPTLWDQGSRVKHDLRYTSLRVYAGGVATNLTPDPSGSVRSRAVTVTLTVLIDQGSSL